MSEMKKMPKIALGAWAWGDDGTFGGNLTSEQLCPVFDAAMQAGLNLWDTAYAHGMGTSEKVLGEFLRTVPRDSYLISDKFTPQCADPTADNAISCGIFSVLVAYFSWSGNTQQMAQISLRLTRRPPTPMITMKYWILLSRNRARMLARNWMPK